MDETEFAERPPIRQELIDEMCIFPTYLIFRTEKRGHREYFCTACREYFDVGERILKETLPGTEVQLWHAGHKSQRECPRCGKSSMVVNEKMVNLDGYSHFRNVCFFVAKAPDDVWFRCLRFFVENQRAVRGRGEPHFVELFAYHLRPGYAKMWRKWGVNGEWEERDDYFAQPFQYDFGMSHEAEEFWTKNASNLTIDETFLRYSGYSAVQQCFYNFPEIRYLCWYAKHPQLEMVAKTGNSDLLCDVVLKSKELTSLIDWNAKKPWDFYRLDHATYNEWCKGGKVGDMATLRVINRLHMSGKPAVELAESILSLVYGNKIEGAYDMIARARRYKAKVQEVIRYIEKQADRMPAPCRWAYQPAEVQAYDTWLDYLDMAKKAGLEKKINPFPKDLKKEHDRLLGVNEQMEAAKREKERRAQFAKMKAEAKEEAKEIAERFPKVDAICKNIKAKFEWEKGDYAVVCPDGIGDILLEGKMLCHCIARVDRYYERIQRGESYLLFLRKTAATDDPWYTLEVEPGGTVRQKRTVYDQQNKDLERATDFLREWQEEVHRRMTEEDRESARESKRIRIEEFAELRKTKTVVHNGVLRGKLLADVLEADLMEIEIEEEGTAEEKTGTA